MSDVIGIRFVTAGPIGYHRAEAVSVGLGDYVVVQRAGGEQLGWVVLTPDQVIAATIEEPLGTIERLATSDDVDAWRQQRERAEENIGRAQALAARTDPRVRVASLVFDLSGERAEVTFTGREKTSYAWLRRELSELLVSDTHVTLVGDRDRAKAMGPGVMGVCGRELCCTSWMTSFPAVSIRMAKEQGLSPNPSKISGLCGRLLCCLSFEVEAYRELRGQLPDVGRRVTTPSGRAKVIGIDALAQRVRLRLDQTGEVLEIPADDLRQQYGTVVRPEELEQAVEEPARAEAAALARDTIAILEPVTRRPTSRRSGRRGAPERSEQRSPPAEERSGGSRNKRRRGRSRSGAARAGGRGRAPGSPVEAPRAGLPPGAEAAPERSSETETVEPASANSGQRRRRRGRRGGRRRGAAPPQQGEAR